MKVKRKFIYVRNKNHKTKEMLEKFPEATLTLTTYAMRWVLLLILIYIIISSLVLFFTESFSFLTQIVTLSIGGFFGFFMGYFGWMFAQQITEWISGREEQETFFRTRRKKK